ncbi:MAG: DUF3833 family protein, partial [Gammaproteobacteria bacterium]
MKWISTISLLSLFIGLAGCSTQSQNNKPPNLKLEDYFQGKVRAFGLVKDWRGIVNKTFVVTMRGNWKGEEGILEEDFLYNDGKTQHRKWHFKKIDEKN